MNGRTRGWSIAATMIAIVALVAAVSAWVRPAVYGGVGAQLAGGPTNFSGVHVAVPTAQATATPGVLINSAAAANPFEVQIASTPMVAVEDNGELALSGALDLAALLYPSFVNLAVTDGYTLTAAYTVYSLDTTGAVTITLAADADEGQPLILINDDANAVVIADTNLSSADGNAITLTDADDLAIFVYQDNVWHEIASPDGS